MVLRPEVDRLMDDTLKSTIGQILQDKDYIRNNHDIPWSNIVPKFTRLIKSIVETIYLANLDHNIANPLNQTRCETIGQFINRINKQLLTTFKESPPFTIHHLASIISFHTPGYQLPDKSDYSESINKNNGDGLKTYTVTVKSMITNEQKTTTQPNNYYHSPGTPNKLDQLTKITNNGFSNGGGSSSNDYARLNEVYAIKFLRSLERSVFVQSSIDDINSDLQSYGSDNTTSSKPVNENEEVNDSSHCQTMVRIPWLTAAKESKHVSVTISAGNSAPDAEEAMVARHVDHDAEMGTDSPKRHLPTNEEERTIKRSKSISNIKEGLEIEAEKEKEKNGDGNAEGSEKDGDDVSDISDEGKMMVDE